MFITYEDGVFTWHGHFEDREAPKKAGFTWTKEKTWVTDLPMIADRIKAPFEGRAVIAMEKFRRQIEASKATDAKIDIPVPEGLSYLPFQKAGIAYTLNQFNRKENSPSVSVLLADEMGL